MKMKLKHLVLFLLILNSCQSAGEYFGRPDVIPTINYYGTGYRNGVEIDTSKFICVDPDEYSILQDYYEDKEVRLYQCLRFGRCK